MDFVKIIMVPVIVPIIIGLITSSGFWAYIQTRITTNKKIDKMLVGMAHQKIIEIGGHYIERGWIYAEEYDDFMKYLADPYLEYGANGLAQKIINEVQKLPLKHISKDNDDEK